MAQGSFTRKDDFEFKHIDQLDEPVFSDTTELKTNLDSQAVELRTYTNDTLLEELEANDAPETSGANKIGLYSTFGDNVQDAIDAIEAAGTGSVPPDETITDAKMASDIKIGSLSSLVAIITGAARNSVVAAINFVTELLGNLSSLDTTEKSNLVGAINEVNSKTASVLTTQGDLLVRGAVNNQRLPIGTARKVLSVNSTANGLEYVDSLQSLMTAQGDILVASGVNAPTRLAIDSTPNKALISNGTTIVYGYSLLGRYDPSDSVLKSANTERTFNGTNQIRKQFGIQRQGKVRIKGEFKTGDGNVATLDISSYNTVIAPGTLTVIGTGAGTLSTSYVSFSMDTTLDVMAGGVIALRGSCAGVGISIRNVTICASESGILNSVVQD